MVLRENISNSRVRGGFYKSAAISGRCLAPNSYVRFSEPATKHIEAKSTAVDAPETPQRLSFYE